MHYEQMYFEAIQLRFVIESVVYLQLLVMFLIIKVSKSWFVGFTDPNPTRTEYARTLDAASHSQCLVMAQSSRFGSFICFAWIIIVT